MSLDEVLHKGLVLYRGDDCEMLLYGDRVTWENIANPSQKGQAKFENVYGAKVQSGSKKKIGFVILGLSIRTSKKKIVKKIPVEIQFVTSSLQEAQDWVQRLREKLQITWHCPVPRKPVFIIVNPFSGEKKGVHLFNEIVKPMLESSGLEYEMTETQRPGHATELAKELQMESWSAIATLSGDGLLHEVLQGMLGRNSWRTAAQVPLALLPAGSGNGLMKSFDSERLEASVFNLIKGYTEPIDILSVRLGDSTRIFCHLALFWGLLADADIESDRYRFVGPARFTLGAVVRLVNLRSYHGTLRYLPATGSEDIQEQNEGENTGPPHHYMAHLKDCPESWEEVEVDFILFCGSNVAWIATDVCIAPDAHHQNGVYDLVWIDRKSVNKADLAKLLLQAETGKHVNHPAVKYVKAKAFSILPTDLGILDVDGEPVAIEPFTAEVLPSLCKLIIPPNFGCESSQE